MQLLSSPEWPQLYSSSNDNVAASTEYYSERLGRVSSAGPAGNTRAKKKQIYFYTEVFEARVCKLKCTQAGQMFHKKALGHTGRCIPCS